jgi:SagB-type dehydrogenase family enzyme
VTLPAPDDVTASLASALHARHSAHTWAGTLTARQLASLLWTAAGGTRQNGYGVQRPYPSAGAAYVARLRIVALDVDDLAPGCYDVDEVSRQLLRTGPAPSVADLEATSMWFGQGATPLDRTPALLGLYVRNGVLRRKYGLRALRFAYAEAGHLAQNLGLVAAVTGLSLGVIGGFYDDVAHDVLGLDGVDESLVYLLPLASGN